MSVILTFVKLRSFILKIIISQSRGRSRWFGVIRNHSESFGADANDSECNPLVSYISRATPSLRGVVGEVVWYPKWNFKIVTRVTTDLWLWVGGLYNANLLWNRDHDQESGVWSHPSYEFEILFWVPYVFSNHSP